MEELEQALREYGMSNDKDIKEIISDVDADNVSTYKAALHSFFQHFNILNQPAISMHIIHN